MVTVELAAPPPPAAEVWAGCVGAGGLAAGSATADSVVVHPYLYPHTNLKLPGGKAGVGKQLRKLARKGAGEKEAAVYATALDQARHSLITGGQQLGRRRGRLLELGAAGRYTGCELGAAGLEVDAGAGTGTATATHPPAPSLCCLQCWRARRWAMQRCMMRSDPTWLCCTAW